MKIKLFVTLPNGHRLVTPTSPAVSVAELHGDIRRRAELVFGNSLPDVAPDKTRLRVGGALLLDGDNVGDVLQDGDNVELIDAELERFGHEPDMQITAVIHVGPQTRRRVAVPV